MSTLTTRSIVLTDHAVERYNERVKPALTPLAARAELEMLLTLCEKTPQKEAPAWYISKEDNDLFLEVSDDLWLVIADGHRPRALTLLVAGSLTQSQRQMRNRARKERNRAKRSRDHGQTLHRVSTEDDNWKEF